MCRAEGRCVGIVIHAAARSARHQVGDDVVRGGRHPVEHSEIHFVDRREDSHIMPGEEGPVGYEASPPLLFSMIIGRFTSAAWAPNRLLLQFARKIVEHAQLIAVEIGDRELAQVPRFVLRLSKDLRTGGPPAMVEFVHFLLAIEIQPDHDCPAVAVVLAERSIRQEHAALPLRDAANAALVVAPVEMETEHVDVIFGGCLDIANGNLWNRLGKVREHVRQFTPVCSGARATPSPVNPCCHGDTRILYAKLRKQAMRPLTVSHKYGSMAV